MGKLRLRAEHCLFRALAFDELAYLTAQSSHHVEQLLFRLSYLMAEKLHDPQDGRAEQNRESKTSMQSRAHSNRPARKISVLGDIGNVCGLTAGPNPAWEPNSGSESVLPNDGFKLRDLHGRFVPNFDAA